MKQHTSNQRVQEEVSRETGSTAVWGWGWVWCQGSWHSHPGRWQQAPQRTDQAGAVGVRLGTGVGKQCMENMWEPVVLFSAQPPSVPSGKSSALVSAETSPGQVCNRHQVEGCGTVCKRALDSEFWVSLPPSKYPVLCRPH